MSEIGVKTGEVESKNSETKSSYDPDKKIGKGEVSEQDETKAKDTEYDPDKKVEKKISYEIHTRNESLEGEKHPITGVPFEKKTVKDADGNYVTGVFPEFESVYDAQLSEDLYQATDKEQFAECNKQLKESVEKDPELARKFTPEQLEQIKNGDTPDGYTWHHNEETGKMQLVESDTHAKTGHTGGKTIWGGGNENR
ncbi:MAG: HNH endonuclease [Treponema sp.]|nr:HNH endonuclease [Treponema sp.]